MALKVKRQSKGFGASASCNKMSEPGNEEVGLRATGKLWYRNLLLLETTKVMKSHKY